MNQKKIRWWRQRFDNFENACELLKKYIDIADPDELQRAGIIQFYESLKEKY